MYSLIYEIREDEQGDYYHLVPCGNQPERNKGSMKKADDIPTAEEIARMADRGEDVSSYFTNRGSMKMPIQRVNVDFTVAMLRELDLVAAELNISRQAVIKSYLRQALDQHNIAKIGTPRTVRKAL